MNANSEDTIIRFSGAWWAYMIFKLGFLRAMVNGVEDALAITGRFLLLVFLMYCGAKAGLLLADPTASPPGWLEVVMFLLQLAGLEGSIPGLARQADALRARRDHDAAAKLDSVMVSARVMTVLAIAEGGAHALQLDVHILQWASAILLVARGVVITGFLIALARIEAKAPRVLSKDAHAREQAQQAQNSDQARQIKTLQDSLRKTQEDLTRISQEKDTIAGQLADAEEQVQLAADTRGQLDQTHRSQAQLIADLQRQLAQVTHELTSITQRSERQVTDLSSQLLRSQQEVTDLTSKLEKVTSSTGQQEVKPKRSVGKKQRSAEVTEEVSNRSQGTVLQFVPKSDEVRRKLNPQEVKAWCDAHPDLTQAEQAAQLGISDAANLRRLLRRARDLEEGGQAANDQ